MRVCVFLTTGASEANALAILFLARLRKGGAAGACRVCPPEYPPMFDTAQWAGFRLTEGAGTAEIAIVSQPRNPEGDLWERTRFLDWTSDARSVLVDETFREFAGTRSLLGTDHPGLWASGSFTKFFAGDDLRVGFLVAPEERAPEFARFHGLVTNLLAPFSVAGASPGASGPGRDPSEGPRRATRQRGGDSGVVPAAAPARGPGDVRPPRDGGGRGCSRPPGPQGVGPGLPGSFFGDPSGVRLCLTRRSFPADLEAYLAVRARVPRGRTPANATSSVSGRGARVARRPPGGSGRAKASPS